MTAGTATPKEAATSGAIGLNARELAPITAMPAVRTKITGG